MNRTTIFFSASLSLGLAAACGGSSSNTPAQDGGNGQDSTNSSSRAGPDGATASDGATGRDASTGANPGIDADNIGNGGNDCTSCMAPLPVCCATSPGGNVQTVCVADQGSCPAGASLIACLGPTGCTGGQVCCETGGGTPNASTACAGSCTPTSQVCQTAADCPTAAPDCNMNGTSGDVGYGVCRPVPDGGGRGMREGGANDTGTPASDTGTPASEGGATETGAAPAEGGSEGGGSLQEGGGPPRDASTSG